MEKDTLGNGKKKLSGKWIALVVIVCAVVAACAVLLGLYYGTLQDPLDLMEIPVIELPVSYRTTVARTDAYLGHPDLTLADGGDLIVVYPQGHGRGKILMQRYEVSAGNNVRTWSEPLLDTPSSWENSQETPTIYRLTLTDGSVKTVLISGCPSWNGEEKANGFNCSVSDGDGYEWTEFTNWYGEEWATENEQGNAVWSEPQVLVPDQRDYYAELGMCEVEIVDTGDAWILLGRANARNSGSLACVSYDQGATWSEIKELPNCLTGDRHKAEYDPTTGKWLISFRQVLTGKETIFSSDRIMGAGWVAWTGDTQTLLNLALGNHDTGYGDALILLGREKDTSVNIDCGYSGTANVDGTFTLVSYGEFDKSATNPYIMAVTFRLSDLGI